ncbi:two-component system, OmpR family, sensor histidine kinase KdpD [Azospirillaceae bacterium]
MATSDLQLGKKARGRLKVFLGAAPGVGKTYAMLLAAQALKKERADVVVGVVETHRRAETEALVHGLEIVPPRKIEYKGRILEEMDVDGVLKRYPHVVLVDELAHTNAVGSRHLKRWLDVEELLANGIDVFTTVNVQHLESLNDVVAQITRIRVRETVPDSILERADEVELVDLTPEHLTKRLSEGKVYVREQAQRALAHYFSPGNLTALRELALRCTAQRVDDQMLNYMKTHAIQGTWATTERVLVCIDHNKRGAALVRNGKRLADRIHAKWTVLFVETPEHAALSDVERDLIADTLRLAERLGATALSVFGNRIADDILAYAQENNITQIVIGPSVHRRLPGWSASPIAATLMKRSGNISIHFMAGDDVEEILPSKKVKTRSVRTPFSFIPYLVGTAMVVGALGVSLCIDMVINTTSVPLAFLVSVFGSAMLHGLKPSLYASLLSVSCYNYFFLPPLYSFSIADPENVVALFFFFLISVLTSHFTANSRGQINMARRRAKSTEELYAFSRKLAGIIDLDDLLWAAAYQIAVMLRVNVVILMPVESGLAVRAGYPPEDQLSDNDRAAAQWTWDHNCSAGRGAETLPGAHRLFLPVRTARGPVAVIGVADIGTGPILTPDQRRLFDALADQTAIAIERILLVQDVDEAKLLSETEKLRSALLNSLSHDLRTPLSSIMAAASSLQSYEDRYDAAMRQELVTAIQVESERMHRFVNNLLDMTRLEAGALEPKRDVVDISDAVGAALRRLERLLSRHRVSLDIPTDLPMACGDFVLIEQILFNLLDNAVKYGPLDSEIIVRARGRDNKVVVTVADEGPGIPEDKLEMVFNKFYRFHEKDRQRAGTGLGLAICRGFVEAMDGAIVAANRLDCSGAIITVTLPAVPELPEILE